MIGAVELQEQYSALPYHGSCVTVSIQAKSTGAKHKCGSAEQSSPEFSFAYTNYFPIGQFSMLTGIIFSRIFTYPGIFFSSTGSYVLFKSLTTPLLPYIWHHKAVITRFQ